jgi:hypothetical protein
LFRRAIALNLCSSSSANFFSKPSSRLSNVVMPASLSSGAPSALFWPQLYHGIAADRTGRKICSQLSTSSVRGRRIGTAAHARLAYRAAVVKATGETMIRACGDAKAKAFDAIVLPALIG